MKNRTWTPGEDSVIEKHYYPRCPVGVAKFIAEQIDRTVIAVKERARKLGKSAIKERRWTREEDDFISKNYQDMSDKKLAKKLNRTEDAVLSRRGRLKLKRTTLEPTTFSMNEIAKAIGLDVHCVSRWVDEGLLPAKRGRNKRVAHEIQPEALLKFMQENPGAWCTRKGPRIIAEINRRIVEKDLRKWRKKHGHEKRSIPKDLRPAFAKFVADVATDASDRIRAVRNPDWLQEKRHKDNLKPGRQAEKWTPEEDRLLRKFYVQGIGYAEMAEKLGRSYAAVAHRMGRTNIWAA